MAELPGPLVTVLESPSAFAAGIGQASLRSIFTLRCHHHSAGMKQMPQRVRKEWSESRFCRSVLALQPSCSIPLCFTVCWETHGLLCVAAVKDTLKDPKAFRYCVTLQKNLTVKQFREANEGMSAEPATSHVSSALGSVSSVPLK